MIAWLFLIYIIQHQQMKERIVYSPKSNPFNNQFDINFKKSPQKYVLYDSPQQPKQYPTANAQSYYLPHRQFDGIKKISDEASSLRQTMSHRKAQQLIKKQILQQQEEKPNKLNDFLRQTMSYKTTKAYSEKFSDLTSSKEICIKKDDNTANYTPLRSHQPYRIGESKSSSNLYSQNAINNVQLLNQKIDRNKKLIEQLRKTARQQDKDYLKNVNHNKSPSYLELDHQKQTNNQGFKKMKRPETLQFMTPKLNKDSYENRFKSSPLIEDSKPNEEELRESGIKSMSTISNVKRKTSFNQTSKLSSMTDDFQMGRKLGEGKFGCVNIVRHKKSLGIFALKKIPKALIKSHMMIEQLALEIRLQICLNHKNILGMYGFFDDKTHLYIVLEYMNGGTLYQKLKKGVLSEKEAAAIIRQITQSIDYLHDLGIAHRDLKPENIVISNNVYKLCDFGWAAMCNERRKTYCGTFDYVAPQILEGVDYDMTVDLWCLGVMTFELMTGKAPFYHISRKETMKKILNVENQNIIYPEGMSELARDFIDKLIKKNPLQRIKASQALLHPFIKDATFD